MATATLVAYQWASTNYSSIAVSQTMAMMTLTFCQIFAALNLRYHTVTIFRMETLSNPRLFYAIGSVLLLAILVTNLGLFQAIFGTASLSKQDWLLCLGAGLSVLALSEIFKFIFKLTIGRKARSRS